MKLRDKVMGFVSFLLQKKKHASENTREVEIEYFAIGWNWRGQ